MSKGNPFRNWTVEDVQRHNAQFEAKAIEKWTPKAKAVERESKLHEQIIQYCRDKRWLYFHSRMDQKSTATVGQPDFTILMREGRVLFVECKAKGKKLRPEQQTIKTIAAALGHEIHVVYSLDEFIEATTNQKGPQ